MRKEKLLKLMSGGFKCLVCEAALNKIQELGFGDLAFAFRCMAEKLWTDNKIGNETKIELNNHLSTLIQHCVYTSDKHIVELNNTISKLDKIIGNGSSITESWTELKELIIEARATQHRLSGAQKAAPA